MREIVLDTETTGLDPKSGHRIVEIGCIELVNHLPTGENFHRHVNPQRDMPAEAAAVHGLTEAFLADKPLFAEVADEFLTFIGDSPLVIHNAQFDMGFVNAELDRLDRPPLDMARAIDTVSMARRKYPGAPANLDALCRRFEIDLSARTLHGALLDAELLAAVYLELIGGRQPDLVLGSGDSGGVNRETGANRTARPPRPHTPSAAEEAAHAAFIATFDSAIWTDRD